MIYVLVFFKNEYTLVTLVFSRFRFVSFKKALLLSFSIFLSVQTKAKIKVMRIFAYAAKMH